MDFYKIPMMRDADEGEEVLEGMCADGGMSLRDARINSGRAGGQVSTVGVRSGPGGIVSKDPRTVST
jgi:hypothetical protein